jgi:hypothetical protein
MTYRTRGEHANYYTTDAVKHRLKLKLKSVVFEKNLNSIWVTFDRRTLLFTLPFYTL